MVLAMDILFASSKGSQYRYFKALVAKLPYRCSVTTLYPCLPSFKDFEQLTFALLKKGVAFHVARKKAKVGLKWLPDWVWWLYTVKAYVRFALIYVSFHAYFRKNSVGYVGVWNGHRLPEMAIKLAARKLGVKTIYFENGLLPNTTVMDFTGVNDKGSLVRNPEFYRSYARKHDHDSLNMHQIIPRIPHKNKMNQKLIERPKGVKYLFVPFQVGFDSQILINSNWINSMQQFYEVLEQVVNRIKDKDLVLVVKEHPSDPRGFKELHGRHPRIYFSNESTEELIVDSEAVITINSSVGLESLMLNKKVIVLGEACYKVPLMTQSASSAQELEAIINGINDWQCDSLALKGYLSYLSGEYLLKGAWQNQINDPSQEHIISFIKKMRANLENAPQTTVSSERQLLAS